VEYFSLSLIFKTYFSASTEGRWRRRKGFGTGGEKDGLNILNIIQKEAREYSDAFVE
jgi:hypothetical protein